MNQTAQCCQIVEIIPAIDLSQRNPVAAGKSTGLCQNLRGTPGDTGKKPGGLTLRTDQDIPTVCSRGHNGISMLQSTQGIADNLQREVRSVGPDDDRLANSRSEHKGEGIRHFLTKIIPLLRKYRHLWITLQKGVMVTGDGEKHPPKSPLHPDNRLPQAFGVYCSSLLR